jgi:predicted ester cyclase
MRILIDDMAARVTPVFEHAGDPMGTHGDFVRWLLEVAWTQGETETLGDELPGLTFHHGGVERQTDGDDLAAIIHRWLEGFPDLRFEVADLLEQEDRVAVRARLSGTHHGTWRGLSATGKRIEYDVAMFFRWEDDRLVEVWEIDDTARRDRQLGIR